MAFSIGALHWHVKYRPVTCNYVLFFPSIDVGVTINMFSYSISFNFMDVLSIGRCEPFLRSIIFM
jgi:hypothetical protein